MDHKRWNHFESERLREALQSVVPLTDEQRAAEREKMVKDIQAIYEQVTQAADEKQRRERMGFAVFLKSQVRFIGWRIWCMQAVGIILLHCMWRTISRQVIGDVLNIGFFLCCLSVLILLSAVPMLYRSVRYAMFETELVTRFSAVRLLIARLLAIGIGNVIILGIVLFSMAVNASIPAARALLYLLLPYLTASSGFLYLLKRIPADKLQVYSTFWGCFLVGIFIVLRRFCPAFFMQTFSVFWAAVCLVLLFFCIRQFYDLMYDSAAYAEID